MKHSTICLAALLGLAACQQKEAAPEQAPETAAAAPTPPPSAEPMASAEPAEEELDIPTPEDFEEEAIEDITAENMEEELDRLEAEIGG